MGGSEAFAAALALREHPHLVRAARACPLPKGTTLLLEAAAGDKSALAAGMAKTGRSELTLRKAAGFFIEQILLSPDADSYRILGASAADAENLLRRHMALIMRWLHPDAVANGGPLEPLNRSIYAARVVEAWANLKTPERRASYDEALAQKAKQAPSSQLSGRRRPAPLIHPRRPYGQYGLKRGSFWNRIILLFAGRQ
jgi:hypothetical protein